MTGGWLSPGHWCVQVLVCLCLVRCPCHVAPRSPGTGTPVSPPCRPHAHRSPAPPLPRAAHHPQPQWRLCPTRFSIRMTGSLTLCIYGPLWGANAGFYWLPGNMRATRWPSPRPCDLHKACHPGAQGPSSQTQTPDFQIICVFRLSAVRDPSIPHRCSFLE